MPHDQPSPSPGILRMHAGSHPDDPRLASLIGELPVRSEDFRRLWTIRWRVNSPCRTRRSP